MKLSRLLNNIEVKLICLLLAVVLWLYASNPKGTETIEKFMKTLSRDEEGLITFRDLPVKVVGIEKKWKAEPENLLLEVKCLDAEIDIENFQIVVNLKRKDEANPGAKIPIKSDNVVLPKGLVFLRTEPKEIKLVSLQ